MGTRLVQLIAYLYFHQHAHCNATLIGTQSRGPSLNASGNVRSLPDLASLCPYNKFCSSSPLKYNLSTEQEPCCQKCSCELDCHETGRCCPDMPFAGIVKPKYPCIPLSDLAKNLEIFTGINFWYHVITDCSDTLRALKYPKCYQPKEVQDFVIVSDSRTGKVYRNKHCAECNDVQDYVNWKLQLKCNDMSHLLKFGGFVESERYILENCTILPLPLDSRISDMSQCFPESEVKTKCNSTGNWAVYDKEIETACLENRDDQNAIFITNDNTGARTGDVMYANVYCYLCNVAKNAKKTDVCKARDKYLQTKTGMVSLFAIIDAKVQEDDEAIKDNTCKSHEIWDPFTELCRPLICPVGKTPVYGSCTGTFAYLGGYAVAINFEVIFLIGSMAASENLLQVLENRFYRELGEDLDCGKCDSTLFLDRNSSSTVFLRLELFTTAECQDDILLKRIRQLAIKRKMFIRYKYRGQQFRVELRLILEDIVRGDRFEDVTGRVSAFCSISKIIDSSIFQYCPQIKLTKAETDMLNTSSTFESLSTGSARVDNGSLEFQQVCVDTYFLANKLSSGAISTYQIDAGYTTDLCLKILAIIFTRILYTRI